MTQKIKHPSGAAPKIQQSYDDVLQASIKRWKAKGDNAEEVITNCAFALKIANELYYKPANIPLPFDPDILLEVINQDRGFNRTLEVNKKQRITGIIMEFLILFGCNAYQAGLAVAEWNGESESTVKNARILALEGEIDGDTIGFFFRNLAVAQFFIRETEKKKFPLLNPYLKAREAFERLRLACDDAKVNRAIRPFISQSGFDYKEIYELLISIHPDMQKLGKFKSPAA